MTSTTLSLRCSTLLVLSIVVGCNAQDGLDVAPVSGRITLDGKPIRGAIVQFTPTSERADRVAGYNSRGITDEDGRYTLNTVEKESQEGAVVGGHQVIISTYRTQPDPSNPEKSAVISEETIPAPYNDYRISPLEFRVEPGGTDQADFSLSRSKTK